MNFSDLEVIAHVDSDHFGVLTDFDNITTDVYIDVDAFGLFESLGVIKHGGKPTLIYYHSHKLMTRRLFPYSDKIPKVIVDAVGRYKVLFDDEQRLFDLQNKLRTKNLFIDDFLLDYARNWASKMKKDNFFHHSVLKNSGLPFSSLAENIYNGGECVDDVLFNWMRSEGHKNNIINESYTHVGIGKAGHYWCVVFGAK